MKAMLKDAFKKSVQNKNIAQYKGYYMKILECDGIVIHCLPFGKIDTMT